MSQSATAARPGEIAGRYQVMQTPGRGRLRHRLQGQGQDPGPHGRHQDHPPRGPGRAGRRASTSCSTASSARPRSRRSSSTRTSSPSTTSATPTGISYLAMEFIDGVGLDRVIATEGRLPIERAALLARAGGGRPRLRPQQRRRPPRHQARQHHDRAGRPGEGHRLRHRQGHGLGRPPHHDRQPPGHAVLHEPGAGARQPRSTAAATSSRWAAILYEMLAGKKAFRGDSITGLIFKIITEEPQPIERARPRTRRRDGRASSRRRSRKAPETRYQTGRELADDLLALTRAGSIADDAPVGDRHRARLLGVPHDRGRAAEPQLRAHGGPARADPGRSARRAPRARGDDPDAAGAAPPAPVAPTHPRCRRRRARRGARRPAGAAPPQAGRAPASSGSKTGLIARDRRRRRAARGARRSRAGRVLPRHQAAAAGAASHRRRRSGASRCRRRPRPGDDARDRPTRRRRPRRSRNRDGAARRTADATAPPTAPGPRPPRGATAPTAARTPAAASAPPPAAPARGQRRSACLDRSRPRTGRRRRRGERRRRRLPRPARAALQPDFGAQPALRRRDRRSPRPWPARAARRSATLAPHDQLPGGLPQRKQGRYGSSGDTLPARLDVASGQRLPERAATVRADRGARRLQDRGHAASAGAASASSGDDSGLHPLAD